MRTTLALLAVLAVLAVSCGCTSGKDDVYAEQEQFEEELRGELGRARVLARQGRLTEAIQRLKGLNDRARAIDPALKDEIKREYRLRMRELDLKAKDHYLKVKEKADECLKIDELESAVAEYRKFPEEFRDSSYWTGNIEPAIASLKKEIAADARYPNMCREAQDLEQKMDYRGALRLINEYRAKYGGVLAKYDNKLRVIEDRLRRLIERNR